MSTTTTSTSTRTTLQAESSSALSSSSVAPGSSNESAASPQKTSQAQPEKQKQQEQQQEEPDIYDEIEIEDMTYDSTLQIYHYPCPCGDRFEIAIQSLRDGEDIAVCPGCSLTIRVIFDPEDLEKEGG